MGVGGWVGVGGLISQQAPGWNFAELGNNYDLPYQNNRIYKCKRCGSEKPQKFEVMLKCISLQFPLFVILQVQWSILSLFFDLVSLVACNNATIDIAKTFGL